MLKNLTKAAAALLAVAALFMASACSEAKYTVFFMSQEYEYRAGDEVKLDVTSYANIDGAVYSFYIGDEYLPYEDDGESCSLVFTMPEHDVYITYASQAAAVGND